MKKRILFLLMTAMVLLSACQSLNLFKGKEQGDTTASHLYTSTGNDVASVKLSLNKNNKFRLVYKDPSTGDEKTFKGRWEEKDKQIILRFKKGVEVKELFPPDLTPRENVTIIDENTVRLGKNAKGIWVWGIYCPKE